MKKIAILIVLMLFSVGFLSGCNDKTPTIIGSWKGGSTGGTITFKEDNTVEMMSLYNIGIAGTYQIENDIITISATAPDGTDVSFQVRYEFIDYNNVKFYYLINGVVETYERLSR